MRKVLAAAVLASGILTSAAPAQDAVNAKELSWCLLANSGDEELTTMRSFLLAALSEDVAGMQSALASFSEVLMRLSMSKCGLGLTQMDDAGFEEGAEIYGGALAERVMERALANMN